MRGHFILAIDQGTSSSRALVFNGAGDILGIGQQALPQHYPRPGRVEQDPLEIWQTVRTAIGEALHNASITPRDLVAVGITNQRETVVTWDAVTGEPLAPAIVWQDRRTATACQELRDAGHESTVVRQTGLTIDPYFSATKIQWLLDNVPDLRDRGTRGEALVGTVDSWLIWKLTGGQRHVTDFTNASRTMLFNVLRGRWDDELLDLFGVPRAMLPVPQPSRSRFGSTSGTVFGAEVPILGVAGDQQAALFGQACLRPGQAKNTYGTGCFLLANAGRKPVTSANRLLVSLGAGSGQDGPEYVVEGSVFVAGALIDWLRDGLGIIHSALDIEPLAATAEDSHGVTIVPAFTGLGAPHWDPHARGAILGITRGVEKSHIARAALDAIALSSAELLLAMNRDLPQPVTELRVDGGAARNDLLLQIQADVLGVPVVRPRHTETTAAGAAYLAGIGAGVWANYDEVAALWRPDRTFEPRLGAEARHARMAEWRRAVERSLDWASE